ncbi:MAG: deoxyribose-phosphate aldolase [Bacteroidetes bacterium]|uniref:Deoxyribose-phosphate aldolase n=1 Tax=Candidatus Cryptobacteroides merdigallinarum TaxID=2840770 RepID=A0A9D9EIU0_9BACT|nr:deoxyribose-phosphate aldolase [Candidatus Cryptobacteroides merdigallinarum]
MYDLLKKYDYSPDKVAIDHGLEMIAANVANVMSSDVLKECLSMVDLTTLKTEDTPESVRALVAKVNGFKAAFPDCPLPASICVYPNFAGVVKSAKTCGDVNVTVVAACFPSSQSFLEVKLRECELAVLDGADEVDIVLALNSFLAGDYDAAGGEIRAVRETIDAAAASQGRKVTLKVILETGLLLKHELIAAASFLTMENGADFIKTSTGKVSVNATPAAAYVMCQCIAKYYGKTGRMVGFKPAGGISSSLDAVSYYSIVSAILGKEWLDKRYLRFGVSRLANTLLSDIGQCTVNYF